MKNPEREIIWRQQDRNEQNRMQHGNKNEICNHCEINYDHVNNDRCSIQSPRGPISLFLLLILSFTVATVEGIAENSRYKPNFPIAEFNHYLAIGTGSYDALDRTPVISATKCDFGADMKVLSNHQFRDNVQLDLVTLFLDTSNSTIVGAQAKWVYDHPNDLPDYLPGAGMIQEGLTWTGDLALTSDAARYSCIDTEIYAQKGISSVGLTQAAQINSCKFFSDMKGDGFDTTGDFVPTQTNRERPMSTLRTDLRSLYSYIHLMEPDTTMKTNADLDAKHLPTPANINDDTGVYEMNIDEFDVNKDRLAVIDIECNNPENEFVIQNMNWIIESESLSTFAIFRLLGDCTMKVETASILTGDGIVMNHEGGQNYNPNTECLFLPFIGFSAIFVKLKKDLMENTETVFSLNNAIIGGIGFYNLIDYAEEKNDVQNDGGKTKMVVTNTQGCGQFVSPFITFENVRLQTCGFATLAEVDSSGNAARTIEMVYGSSNPAYEGKSTQCDQGITKKIFTCNKEYIPNFSLVTEGDADVGAELVSNSMAIGGQLDNPSLEAGDITNVKGGELYANKIKELERFHLFDRYKTGLKLGATDGAGIDFDFFKYLAYHALPITIERSKYTVFVEKLGGSFDTDDFGAGKGSDTLVIFNTTETVILTKTNSGVAFGPSVIAPFAEVQLEGNAGYIDGIVVAKTFKTRGNTSGEHLEMHGIPYSGPIDCAKIFNYNYKGEKILGQKTIIEQQQELKKEEEQGGSISKNSKMDNCVTQKECIFFDVMEKPGNVCSDQSGCEFEVCLTLDFTKKGCPKPTTGNSTAEYTCEKTSASCMDNSVLSFGNGLSTKISSIENGYRQCQTAGPNTKVEFLLRDGHCGSNSGKATMGITGSGIVKEASCEPRGFSTDTEKSTSCDAFSIANQECVWSVVTPTRCQLYSPNGRKYTDQHGCSVTFLVKNIGNNEQNVVTVRSCPDCADCE